MFQKYLLDNIQVGQKLSHAIIRLFFSRRVVTHSQRIRQETLRKEATGQIGKGGHSKEEEDLNKETNKETDDKIGDDQEEEEEEEDKL